MKQKRKHQSKRSIRNVIYVVVGLALIIMVFVTGLIVGGNNPQDNAPVQSTVITETPVSADSNTVDLPELQTQWAELDIIKTASNNSQITSTNTP